MKVRRIVHWTATLLVIGVMTVSGVMAITHAAPMMIALAHLGYPAYFSNLLGVAKLAGVCVLLAPGLGRLKEWAYTGFAITILSASYSHWCAGDGLMALEPLVTLAALVISYRTRASGRAPAHCETAAGARRAHSLQLNENASRNPVAQPEA